MLDEQLWFEEFLSEISAKFANLPATEVDREIEYGLRRLCECLDVERSTLFELAEPGELRVTHSWAVAGIELVPRIPAKDQWPQAAANVLNGRPWMFSRLEELGEEASFEKSYYTRIGLKSSLGIPLEVGGSIVGALTINSFRTERAWSDKLVQRLRLVGEIFANALQRKRMEQALDEQLRFESLLSEISAKFVNVPASAVEVEMQSALGGLIACLALDRVSLFEFSENDEEIHSMISCQAQGIDPVPQTILHQVLPWVLARLRRGEVVEFTRIDDLPDEAAVDKQFFLEQGTKSYIGIPLVGRDGILGSVSFATHGANREWSLQLVQRLRLLGEVFANVLQRKRAEESLDRAFREINALQQQLKMENLYLREEMKLIHKHRGIVGQSEGIKEVLSHVEQVAGTESTVLIMGETGTGKELIARAIHDMSPRKGRALVKVNCGGFPSTLIESELFGREKGAFTGALSKQLGRFEIADGSTIFLDEVGELPLDLQIKLIRVIQDGEFERLGSSRTIQVDCRVIAATNRDLARAVQAGEFREDLYYRLNVFPIHVPPLRNRTEDIPELVWFFVKEFGERMGKRIQTIPQRSMEALKDYPWPGNVRELMNVIERSIILSRGSTLHVQIPRSGHEGPFEEMTLQELEKTHILHTLRKTRWRVSGKKGAAERLGLKPSTLEYRMKKLGIQRPH